MMRQKRSGLRKKTKTSSHIWLLRHINDPYVHQAAQEGYRSRGAYKLIQIEEKVSFLKPSMRVLDAGCSPGGWCQVLKRRYPSMNIIGVDLLPLSPLPGITFLQGDITHLCIQEQIKSHWPKCDLFLSDIAPSTIGHAVTDHLRMMVVLEDLWAFVKDFLAEQGSLVFKVFQGKELPDFLKQIRPFFEHVRMIKPLASRCISVENYLVATRFKEGFCHVSN